MERMLAHGIASGLMLDRPRAAAVTLPAMACSAALQSELSNE